MKQRAKHDRGWLREAGWEWMIGIILAMPLIALYIYVDQNPSWWGVLGIRLLCSLIFAAPMVLEGLFWMYDSDLDSEPKDHIVWLQALGLTALLAWLLATLPALFTPPSSSPLPDTVDVIVRLSWLVLCIVSTLALLRANPLPEAWRSRARAGFALLILLAGMWPWIEEGLARQCLGGVILGGVSLTVLIGSLRC